MCKVAPSLIRETKFNLNCLVDQKTCLACVSQLRPFTESHMYVFIDVVVICWL